MNNILYTNFDDILHNLAGYLDIPETYFERAKSRYESIGTWLGRPESEVSKFNPVVFPQGSFSLGTVIKPTSDKDDYDIDLVCRLQLNKSNLSQKQLKEVIGRELVGYVEARNMTSPAEERRRCWRLDYADQDVHFHLDVLPSIPDDGFLEGEAIAITDNQLSNYSSISSDWPRCNPIDYLKWFRERMEVQLQIMLKEFADTLKANVEDVPEYKIKTPLQRSIQILKRHRDITYKGNPDNKPISILITTLAGQAYENESSVTEALQNIVMKMREFIEDRNGVSWVANPVNSAENFADKWEQYPKRKDDFFDWLDSVEADIAFLFKSEDIFALKEIFNSRFGESVSNFVTKDMSEDHQISKTIDRKSVAIIDPRKFVVSHKEIPTWNMKLDKKVHVITEVIQDGWRPKRISNGDTISKHRSLRFTALTDAKKPYDVYWQVVNTGQEAKEAVSLRGEFYDSHIRKGRKIRNESTLYQGMHWVECFIVKEDVCVAQSGEFVINIS